jgi:hypothetical protein
MRFSSPGNRASPLSLTAALGGFLLGYDSAVINGAVTAIHALQRAGHGAVKRVDDEAGRPRAGS